MNEYIAKVSVIRTKEKRVVKYTVVQKANSISEAEKIVKDKFIQNEGTGCVFVKEVLKKSGERNNEISI